MRVAVAGGHGQVARRLLRLLAARGDHAVGLVRNPDHVADLEADGAEAVVRDLERDDPADALAGADAVVFAAGAGPGSGPERKATMDLGGAVKLIDAARSRGVDRYVMVSSQGAHDAESVAADSPMWPYLAAKHEADATLAASGLDFTIVRPGSLTDEPGTGRVALSTQSGGRGRVSRDDVAATLAAVLDDRGTIGVTFELFEGDTPIAEAVAALAASR